MNRRIFIGLVALVALALACQSHAGTVGWTNWSAATPSSGNTPGSATGTMAFGSSSVNVTYSGELDSNTQVGGGFSYFFPASTYTSPSVPNAPPGGNMITVTGGTSFTDTVTFSSPVKDFLMAFVSLGNPSTPVTYQFDSKLPISVLSTGPNGVYGGSVPLTFGHTSDGFDTITGQESDGVIQFSGYFSSISWTVPPPGEYWDGWTFGAIAQAPPGTQPGALAPLPSSATMGLTLLLGVCAVAAGRKAVTVRRAV